MGHNKSILSRRRIVSVMLANENTCKDEGVYRFSTASGDEIACPLNMLGNNCGEYYVAGRFRWGDRNLVKSDLTRRNRAAKRNDESDGKTVMNGFHIINVTIDKNGVIRKRKESEALTKEMEQWNRATRYNSKAKMLKQGVVEIINGKIKYTETPGMVDAVIPSIVETLGNEGRWASFRMSRTTMKSLTFRAPIRQIPNGFCCNTLIEKLSLCEGISDIGPNAFFGNPQLLGVDIPKTVRTIGTSAFANNPAAKEYKFNGPLKYLGAHAFEGNSSLETIKLPNGIPEILERTFGNCSSLRYVFIPKSVNKVDTSIFLGCYKGVEVTCHSRIAHMVRQLPCVTKVNTYE